jgi:hypothetical protein
MSTTSQDRERPRINESSDRGSQKESEAKMEDETKAYRGPTETCLGKREATIKTG